jgi:hypothetical protein
MVIPNLLNLVWDSWCLWSVNIRVFLALINQVQLSGGPSKSMWPMKMESPMSWWTRMVLSMLELTTVSCVH